MFELTGDWQNQLGEELQAEYFTKLVESVEYEYQNYSVFPPKSDVLRALRMVDYPSARVCILGQDPYHGCGQANGMAFAVCDGNAFPPSLVNIFKELQSDIGCEYPVSGTLKGWAKQGVLLLNTTLTVRQGMPQSHAGLGWGSFTDAVIKALSKRKQPLVFILWGASAIAKSGLIAGHHLVLTSPHPSPLSAHRGFFGSKPFSKANHFLESHGLHPVDWSDVAGNRASYYDGIHKITII